MKLDLRALSSKAKLRGKAVLVRVDWNVPASGRAMHASPLQERESSLKIERSIPLLKDLQKRGAKVFILTHLGRPKKKDKRFSTRPLVRLLKAAYGLDVTFHPESVGNKEERNVLKGVVHDARPGSLHLLENVRFQKGEEENAKTLATAYAELGDLFVNDAFASCHRAHVSVVGIAKILPSYAGPSLVEEVAALSKAIDKPKAPVVAIIGGLKLSTKLPVIEALATFCDHILIGGAMATPFFKAKKLEVGKSVYEEDAVRLARKLVTKKEIVLPIDVVVTERVTQNSKLKRVPVHAIGKKDIIVDVGPHTLKAWAATVKKAKTVLWNGPVGLSECKPCGFGSRFVARIVSSRARGSAYGIVGGGDTLPVIHDTKTEKLFDFVSTGGGAMLEFIAKRGQLPGVMVLLR